MAFQSYFRSVLPQCTQALNRGREVHQSVHQTLIKSWGLQMTSTNMKPWVVVSNHPWNETMKIWPTFKKTPNFQDTSQKRTPDHRQAMKNAVHQSMLIVVGVCLRCSLYPRSGLGITSSSIVLPVWQHLQSTLWEFNIATESHHLQ